MDKSAEDRVKALLAKELDLEEGDVSDETSRDSCEFWDSLGHLRVCMAFEEEFGVRIPTTSIPEIHSVRDLLELVPRD